MNDNGARALLLSIEDSPALMRPSYSPARAAGAMSASILCSPGMGERDSR
jgi:hypothetical protein